MTRYIAFLRAINVGGHTVKMDELRGLFVGMGFADVETFIASGNVIFRCDDARYPNAAALQPLIEHELQRALGYEVATFLRTDVAVAAIARYEPFPAPVMAAAGALNVAFLYEPLTGDAEERIMTLRTAIDDFHVNGSEVYWLCQTKQSQSTFSNVVFERTVGRRATFRGMNTVQRLAARYSPEPGDF